MAANGSVVRISTGQLDWSGGVNSDLNPTIKGEANPNGLSQNQLAWGNSISVKSGCIAPRLPVLVAATASAVAGFLSAVEPD